MCNESYCASFASSRLCGSSEVKAFAVTDRWKSSEPIKELRERLKREPQVACVPTMGNIHDGHLRLVRIAQQHARFVVTTIFVNRLQFGQGEDFDKYPRTFEDDCDKLAASGVQRSCSIPDETQMYPEPQIFVVDPPTIANKLEGRFRPGHFRGMATVVLKLFNIGATAGGGVRQEGLPATDDRAADGRPVRAADPDRPRGDGARGRRAGAVLAQPLSCQRSAACGSAAPARRCFVG